MRAALICFGLDKRCAKLKEQSKSALALGTAGNAGEAGNLSPASDYRNQTYVLQPGDLVFVDDQSPKARDVVMGLRNPLLLENSPLLVTVISMGPSHRGVTYQNASSKAWLGDLDANDGQQGSTSRKLVGEEVLLRIFIEEPIKLGELLSELDTAGHWKGIVRVAAPGGATISPSQASARCANSAGGVPNRQHAPSVPISTSQVDGRMDLVANTAGTGVLSSRPSVVRPRNAERSSSAVHSGGSVTREAMHSIQELVRSRSYCSAVPSGSGVLSTAGQPRKSLSLADLATLRVPPRAPTRSGMRSTNTGCASSALPKSVAPFSIPWSSLRDPGAGAGAVSGRASQPAVSSDFLLATGASLMGADEARRDPLLRDFCATLPTVTHMSSASSRSPVFDALRTSTFAQGLLDSSLAAKSVQIGIQERATVSTRSHQQESSFTSVPASAARSGASLVSRAVSFATTLKNSPVMNSRRSATLTDFPASARASVAQTANVMPENNADSAKEWDSADDTSCGGTMTSVPDKGADECHAMESTTGVGSSREYWHEVWATRSVDPCTGEVAVLVLQHNVTGKFLVERHLALVMEASHCLLEQIFPRHVLQHMAERTISTVTTAIAEAPAPSLPQAIKPKGFDCDELATWHPQVTLLFADIQGFTPMCNQVEPREVMSMLNKLFSRFDSLLDKYGVFKVETIGDCYFVAGGLVQQDEDGMAVVRADGAEEDPLHAHKVFRFAKAMLAVAREVTLPTTGAPVAIRIGLHTGPVVSGVVGTRMPRFCLFGDTVNTASRMESTGVPGAIHASQATYQLLKDEAWAPTGGLEVKGKGAMQTYLWRPQGGHVEESLPSTDSLVQESCASHIATFVALRQMTLSQGMYAGPASCDFNTSQIHSGRDNTIQSAACNLQEMLSLGSNIVRGMVHGGARAQRKIQEHPAACGVASLE